MTLRLIHMLLHQSISKNNSGISASISVERTGDAVAMRIVCSIPQYIILAPYCTLPAAVHQCNINTIDLGQYDPGCAYTALYYVYAVTDRHLADQIVKIMPESHKEVTTAKSNFRVFTIGRRGAAVYHNATTDTYRIICTTNGSIYLPQFDVTLIPGVPVTLKNTMPFPDTLDMKGTGETLENVNYDSLDYDESDQYIPVPVRDGLCSTIKHGNFYDWVKNPIYTGTLRLLSDCTGKDVIFVNGDGVEYKYTMETLKLLLPHLSGGKVTGTFKFKQYGGSRNISYCLVPVVTDVKDTNIIVCGTADCGTADQDSDSDSDVDENELY